MLLLYLAKWNALGALHFHFTATPKGTKFRTKKQKSVTA